MYLPYGRGDYDPEPYMGPERDEDAGHDAEDEFWDAVDREYDRYLSHLDD